MTVTRYDLRTTDGLSGPVFDASQIFTVTRGQLVPGALTGTTLNLSDLPVRGRRIHETVVHDELTWTVQVWVSVASARSYKSTTSTEIFLTTTTLVISDGHTPVAVAFATKDGHKGWVNKDNLGVGFPGLREWLVLAPHQNPPWDRLRLIHGVLRVGGRDPVLAQSLQLASLGVADPDAAYTSWACGVDLARVPDPPAGVDLPAWTVSWVKWFNHLHALFAGWVTLDDISQPHDESDRQRPSIAARTRAAWDELGDQPGVLAGDWAAAEPNPGNVPVEWIFDRRNLFAAWTYPPDFAREARAAGWTPTDAGTFLRFHLSLCHGCDNRNGRWGHLTRAAHALKEESPADRWAPGVQGWASLMSAELAATHLAAGVTLAEATASPMSLGTARVAAVLNRTRVPAFASSTL